MQRQSVLDLGTQTIEEQEEEAIQEEDTTVQQTEELAGVEAANFQLFKANRVF